MTAFATFAAARATLDAARAAEDKYDAEVWRPYYDQWTLDKTPTPDCVDKEMERLQEARCEIEDACIKVRAETIGDISYKLAMTQNRWVDFCIPDEWIDEILADLATLQTRFAQSWLDRWSSQGGDALLCEDGKVQLGFPTYELSPEYERRGGDQAGGSSRYYATMRTLTDCLAIVPGGVDIIKTHMRDTGQRLILRARRQGTAA